LPIQRAAKPAAGRNYGYLDAAEQQLEIILFGMAHSGEWFLEFRRVNKRSKRGTIKCHVSKPEPLRKSVTESAKLAQSRTK